MMGGQMGLGSGPNNMRMAGPPRNAGMQQIPPSGPMMRAQVRLVGINSRFFFQRKTYKMASEVIICVI